jgi:hypothetical protein
MAILLEAQVQEIFKTPANQKVIKKAIEHEERIKFHVEPVLDSTQKNKACKKFLENVAEFLPAEKYTRFEQLFQFPVPTNELTDSIYNELSRAIKGDGGYQNFEFTSDAQEESFRDYLEEVKHEGKWKRDGWNAFKTAINSILIIDQPLEEVSPPQPYCFFLNISRVIDIKVNKENQVCEYIVFENEHHDDIFHVYDDAFYRLYKKTETGDYNLLSEIAHDIGYCPARMFWSTNLNSNDDIQKQGAITKSLSQLDKVLFWETSIEYYNTYGVFPVIWSYEEKEDEDSAIGSDEFDEETVGGVSIPNASRHPAYQEHIKNNPQANKARGLIGAGSYISIPAPADNQDADLRDPFGYMQIQVESLEFAEKYLQNRKDFVFAYCVGNGKEPKNDQAKNEKQIQSSFESTINILEWIALNFETAENWVLKTKAIVIYGSESVLSISNSLGRKFYLKSVEELTLEYKEQKESGLPAYMLSQTRDFISETKNKGNQTLLLRAKIMSDLEPYLSLSISEVKEMRDSLDPKMVSLKLNFDYYIRKFEREQLPLISFGSLTSYDNKIETINKTLFNYVNQETKNESGASKGDSESGATGG